MANGKGWWAPFYERILDGDIFEDGDLFRVWSWIVLRAKPWRWRAKTRHGCFELGRGEALLNVVRLARRIGVTPTTCHRLLNKLVARGSIVKEGTPAGVKVRLVNIDKYWLYKPNGNRLETETETRTETETETETETSLDDVSYPEETIYEDAPEKTGDQNGDRNGDQNGDHIGQNGDQEMERMLAKVETTFPGRNTVGIRTSGDGCEKSGDLISAADGQKVETSTEEEEEVLSDVLSSVVSIPPVDCTKSVSSVVVPPTPARARKKQLDLIPKEPTVEPEDHADVLQISRAFEAIDAPLWNEIKSDIRWIRHTLKANRDWIRVTKWGELGVVAMVEYCINMAYDWWVGHPKDRWKNVRAGVTRWINHERQDLMGAGRGNGRAQSYPVPTEPGKYDGIGVVNSEFDLS